MKKTKIKWIFPLSICLLLASCSNSGENKLGPSHFPFKESKKDAWGLVDIKGKALVENEFKDEPSPAIDGMFFAKTKKGLEVYSISNPIKSLGETYKDIAYYSEGLAPCVKESEGIKYIDKEGNVKFELPLEYLYADKFVNGYSLIGRKDGVWDAISTNGQITKFADYSIECVLPNGKFFVSGIEGKFTDEDRYYKEYFILDAKGNVIVQLKGMELDDFLSLTTKDLLSPDLKHYVFYDDEGLYGIRNIQGETVVKAKYSRLQFLQDGNVVYYDDKDCGLMDVKGNIIMKPKYSWIQFFSNGKYIVSKDGEMALLNSEEERLIGYEHNVLYGLSNKVLLAYDYGHNSEIITADGKSIASFSEFTPYNYDYERVKSDYFDVLDCIKSMLYPKNGEIDRTIDDLYGLSGLGASDCTMVLGMSLSKDDIDNDVWIPYKDLGNSNYGSISYSLGFSAGVVETYYDEDDYWELRPHYSYANHACDYIRIKLQMNSETTSHANQIEQQIGDVLSGLGYSNSGTSRYGNPLFSNSKVTIEPIFNYNELILKAYTK